MTLWQEALKRFHPKAKFQIEGKGGSTAMAGLSANYSHIGPMSRLPVEREIELFKKYRPKSNLIVFKVALDAIGVFVHKDNPLDKISLAELDAIFSKTRNHGHTQDIYNWGQLGVNGNLASKEIVSYTRNSASGTYGYFKKIALKRGDLKDKVKPLPGSASIINSINIDSIGYSGIGYKTSKVKVLKIRPSGKEDFYEPTVKNILEENYPLGRFLYLVVPVHKEKGILPKVKEFLRFIYSKEGQKIVIKDGYIALNSKIIEGELKKLNSPR